MVLGITGWLQISLNDPNGELRVNEASKSTANVRTKGVSYVPWTLLSLLKGALIRFRERQIQLRAIEVGIKPFCGVVFEVHRLS